MFAPRHPFAVLGLAGLLLGVCGCGDDGPKRIDAPPVVKQEDPPPPVKKPEPPKVPDQPRDAVLGWLPADSPSIAFVEIGKHWSGPGKDSLMRVSSIHPVVLSWWVKDLSTSYGVPPEQVERVWMIANPPAGEIVALTARQPLEREKVLAALAPEAKETKATGRTYHVGKNGDAVYFIDERTLVTGSKESVRVFLDKAGPNKSASFPTELLTNALVVQINAGILSNLPVSRAEGARPFVPLLRATSWTILLDEQEGVRIRLRGEYATERAARDAVRSVAPALKAVGTHLGQLEKSLDEFAEREEEKFKGVKELAAEIKKTYLAAAEALAKPEVVQKGKLVEATVVIPSKTPEATAALLLSALPRAKKEEKKPDEKKPGDQKPDEKKPAAQP
ncbi:MAG: hypothetical protein AB7K24_04425 [Gemmataceae bacterium]